jgi:hypothetical protein
MENTRTTIKHQALLTGTSQCTGIDHKQCLKEGRGGDKTDKAAQHTDKPYITLGVFCCIQFHGD